uniref:Uncharacterized protein n=1 Tax=Tanacetum cinerariifolium TaxID=118510 RepID=A0A6L2LMM7_TANCI|nr:hypothetical protein [Tanacetum cinerariifolium]
MSNPNATYLIVGRMELLKKEKGELETKLTGFQTASKDLENLLESQRLDKNKEELGYSAVPPSPTQIYSPPNKDLSWTGLLEFADDTATDIPTEDKTDKVETAKKPTVKYAKLYRRTSKSSKVRGNQRNWNNLKSQQLGLSRDYSRLDDYIDTESQDAKKGVKRVKLEDAVRTKRSRGVVDYILQVKKKVLTKKLEDSEAKNQV